MIDKTAERFHAFLKGLAVNNIDDLMQKSTEFLLVEGKRLKGHLDTASRMMVYCFEYLLNERVECRDAVAEAIKHLEGSLSRNWVGEDRKQATLTILRSVHESLKVNRVEGKE